MSEQNVLNDSPMSPLNPDWPFGGEPDDSSMSRFTTRSGEIYQRELAVSPHVFDLTWTERELWVASQIRLWEQKFRNSYFTLYDYERNRGYTGRFAGRPQIQGVGFNKWNVSVQFVEEANRPMYEYPSNWAGDDNVEGDSYFIEERDADGNDQVKLTGIGWVFNGSNATRHGRSDYTSRHLNDTADWVYYGYGFRLWSFKAANFGIVEVSLDGAVVGSVDLYAAVNTNSAPVFTKNDAMLGRHRVSIRCTLTKNALSGDYFVSADAIEVMF